MGATGGVAALPLTQAGLEVIGLEAGTWLSPSDFAPDELRNNYRGWPQLVQKANHEVPTHRRHDGAPYSPRPSVHPMMNAVGGTTIHYWAQSWRLNPPGLQGGERHQPARYGASRIPSGSTVEDWPFGLEELEPYYDKVEYEVRRFRTGRKRRGQVGRAGECSSRARGRANIPMPPPPRHRLHRDDGRCRQSDWRASFFPVPPPSIPVIYEGRPGCMYHGWCDRGGCPVNAKSATSVTTILQGACDQAPEDRHPGSGDKDRSRHHGQGQRGDISQGRQILFSARPCCADGILYLRECPASAVVQVQDVPGRAFQRSRRQSRPPRYMTSTTHMAASARFFRSI